MELTLDLDRTLEGLAPRVLRYCRGRCADTSLVEEAAQDALTALVDRWRRHGPPHSPEAFVFTVARRRLSRALFQRGLWRRPSSRLAETTCDDPTSDLRASDADPERHAMDRDQLAKLRSAIFQLSPKLREALLMTTAAELDTTTAAQVLGTSRSAIKMRVSRARQQLTQALEDAATEATRHA